MKPRIWQGQLLASCLAAIALVLASFAVSAAEKNSPPSDIQSGERIYRTGVLADGALLTGSREGGVRVSGAAAACINCHRASGLGGAEGNQLIPPVAGAVLRAPGQPWFERTGRAASGMSRTVPAAHTRGAYTRSSFAQAMVSGRHASGEAMSYLMPRYELDPASLDQLLAYLDTLPLGHASGVDSHALHLATIVTADAPAIQRDSTLAIMSRCIAERSPRPSGNAASPKPWQHHVWRLGADPARWPQELAQYQKRQPVFAVVSGVSGGAWTPIHQFCESEKIPCVLPNTAAVDQALPSHWSFYFSRGVSLEAAALAQHLADAAPPGGWRRVIQRTDNSEAARLGAAALQRHLLDLNMTAELEQQRFGPQPDSTLTASLTERDALVLWLNPSALKLFTATTTPPGAGRVVVSGEMGGLDEAPVATAWRERVWMTYPYEAAARRNPRIVLNTTDWMGRQGLMLNPVLSRLQGNTYSACEVTVRALQTMRSHYSREYFLELVEAADEAAIATAYPRFTLGPNQRYGSSGAFLMRYAAPDLTQLVAVGDWIVPSR
jgi:Cytochrome c